MLFGEALNHCMAGFKITREGWNGPGQFVVHQKGYPDGIPINENTAAALGLPVGTVCKFAPYFLLRNAQGVFIPWLASQGDMQAGDWITLA
jgi:hypothetical protein